MHVTHAVQNGRRRRTTIKTIRMLACPHMQAHAHPQTPRAPNRALASGKCAGVRLVLVTHNRSSQSRLSTVLFWYAALYPCTHTRIESECADTFAPPVYASLPVRQSAPVCKTDGDGNGFRCRRSPGGFYWSSSNGVFFCVCVLPVVAGISHCVPNPAWPKSQATRSILSHAKITA